MPKRLSDDVKLDNGLVSQALNNTNVTGPYFDMSMYRRALFALNGAAMAAGTTTKIEILQAQDEAGTGAKALTDLSAVAVDATITANTKVNEITLTTVSVVATNTVTINGIVFTAVASGSEVYANQTFSVGATPTDAECATDLAACINANFDEIEASVNANVVTVKSKEPGENTITSTADATITVATTKAKAFIEFEAAHLDTNNGFTHVAAKITTTANSNVAASLMRGVARFMPTQNVGASKVV